MGEPHFNVKPKRRPRKSRIKPEPEALEERIAQMDDSSPQTSSSGRWWVCVKCEPSIRTQRMRCPQCGTQRP